MFPQAQTGPDWLKRIKSPQGGLGIASEALQGALPNAGSSPWAKLGSAVGQAGGAIQDYRGKRHAQDALDADAPLQAGIEEATSPLPGQAPASPGMPPPIGTPPMGPTPPTYPRPMKDGGIIDHPTLVMLAEDGPEMVVPLRSDGEYRSNAKIRPSMIPRGGG